jgi:hypothetical protein
LALLAVIWVWRVQLYTFPSIINAYTAKQYCSCRDVMNNPVDYCRSYVKQWLPSTLSEKAGRKAHQRHRHGPPKQRPMARPASGCRLLTPVP